MAKKLVKKAKTVNGADYIGENEEFDRKEYKKQFKEMKTAGIAKEFKCSEKEQGYGKMPKVKPQKKVAKLVSGQKKIGR